MYQSIKQTTKFAYHPLQNMDNSAQQSKKNYKMEGYNKKQGKQNKSG